MNLESWTSFLTVSLLILVGIILYRQLLRYLSRNRIKTEDYCILYDLELESVSGIVEFYFTLPQKNFLRFEILDENWNHLEELAAKDFDQGGHIIRFDTSKYNSGTYFYGIRTEGQVLHKKFKIG